MCRPDPNREPIHPGIILKEDIIEETDGMTIEGVADALGVSRKTLSAICNGRARLTTAIAVRLAKYLGTSVEMWANMQTAHDIWKARQEDVFDVHPFACA